MERERPEYLPPIERRRWTFPWLAFWALAMAALVAGAVHQHVKTSSAWKDRFGKTAAQRFNEMPTLASPGKNSVAQTDAHAKAVRQAAIGDLRLRREAAERQVRIQAQEKAENHRCIDGTVFRRIPGGWENVPGETCRP